ncbi:MAG TPA: NAD(P)-binding domain-containing protein [Chryseolinea sp.]|nr:NAD(P)-binding domain-containing protein [Chryseolinea sp.]
MSESMRVAVLGLGEAGSHFANDLASFGLNVVGYDPEPKRALHANVRLVSSNAEAARDSDLILSVNIASVAVEVANDVFPVLEKGQIFVEMNTASPQTKIDVATILAKTHALVADVAIMAPVPAKGIKSPFLVSGPGAARFFDMLSPYKLDINILSDKVGDAATHKLLRSIVYKGFAAVIGEAINASQSMGLEEYMRSQISALIGGKDELIDRFIEGSKTHALRRSHELDAVVSMLISHNVEPVMSRATLKSLQNLID